MIFVSSRAGLVCHALLCLALRGETGPVSVRTVAASLGTSADYLEQHLLRAKRAGLVRSTRGPRGGFCLAGPAESVTLADIVEAIDGIAEPAAAGSSEAEGIRAVLSGVWAEAGEYLRKQLGTLSLADLVARAAGTDEADQESLALLAGIPALEALGDIARPRS